MFSNILITISGVAIVGTVFEMLLPDSANKKYLKGAMALVLCYIFISGVLSEVKFEGIGTNAGDYSQGINFERQVDDLRVNMQTIAIRDHLESKGFSGIQIDIHTKKEDSRLIIEKIVLGTKNLVITGQNANINITDKLKELVAEFCNMKTDRVEING